MIREYIYFVDDNPNGTSGMTEEEIIRCKDCKHLQKWRSEESAKKFGQIYACARNVFDCPKPEDFCSFAERRAEQ